jgi:hypothetical protein
LESTPLKIKFPAEVPSEYLHTLQAIIYTYVPAKYLVSEDNQFVLNPADAQFAECYICTDYHRYRCYDTRDCYKRSCLYKTTSDGKGSEKYWYADQDVTVNGTYTYSYMRGSSLKQNKIFYSLNMKQGWNLVYISATGDVLKFTSAPPSGMVYEWKFN